MQYQEKQLHECFRGIYEDGDYDYDKFLPAFDDFIDHPTASVGEEVKMWPMRKWFDAELALQNCPQYFQLTSRETLDHVLHAQRMVNRWNFMKAVMVSGEDWMTSSLAFTLLVLATVYDNVDLALPNVRMMDAGCGTGFLAAVWATMTGSDAEVWGLESDPEMAKIACTEIFNSSDSFAIPAGDHLRTVEWRNKITIANGDVQEMVYKKEGQRELHAFPKNFFNVINVGVAMPVTERLVECLKEGGVLILPEAQEKSECQDVQTRVPAIFRILKKQHAEMVDISAGYDQMSIEFIEIQSCEDARALSNPTLLQSLSEKRVSRTSFKKSISEKTPSCNLVEASDTHSDIDPHDTCICLEQLGNMNATNARIEVEERPSGEIHGDTSDNQSGSDDKLFIVKQGTQNG